jgi:hypothetical protein
MAINSNITQRRLVAEIKEWADDHMMIHKFGYGDFLQLYQEEENLYPYFMVNISNGADLPFYFKYTLDVFVAMWVFDDRENQLRSESDSELILRDFTNTIRISNRWQQFARIDSSELPKRKVIEMGGDKVTGWGVTINLSIKKKASICDLENLLPEYDFETQTVSATTITGNDTLMVSLGCGEDYEFEIKDTDGTLVGTWNPLTKLWTVPAAGGGSTTAEIENSNVTYTASFDTSANPFALPDTSVQQQVDGVNYGAPQGVVTLDPNAVLNLQW